MTKKKVFLRSNQLLNKQEKKKKIRIRLQKEVCKVLGPMSLGRMTSITILTRSKFSSRKFHNANTKWVHNKKFGNISQEKNIQENYWRKTACYFYIENENKLMLSVANIIKEKKLNQILQK